MNKNELFCDCFTYFQWLRNALSFHSEIYIWYVFVYVYVCVDFFATLFEKILIRVQLSTTWYQFMLSNEVNQFYICLYPLLFRVFSHVVHCRVLNRVPSPIQQVLIISYLFYIWQYVYVNPNISLLPSLPPAPGKHKIVSYMCMSISVL